MDLLKGIMYALSAICAIIAIVGVFLCGINIINAVFNEGGSYTTALVGFLMTTIGGIFAIIFKPDNR